MFSATSLAERLPLKESGAITIFIVSRPILHYIFIIAKLKPYNNVQIA